MSYILEALKKSQQERELGQVPTLATESYAEPERPSKVNPLVLSALLLASLAVIVALYAVFGNRFLAPREQPADARAFPPAPQLTPTPSPADPTVAPKPLSPSRPPVPQTGPVVSGGKEFPLKFSDRRTAKPTAHRTTEQEAVVATKDQPAPTPAPSSIVEEQPASPPPYERDSRQELLADLRQQFLQMTAEAEAKGENPGTEQPDETVPPRSEAAQDETDQVADETPRDDAAAPATVRPISENQLPYDVFKRLPKRKVSALAYSKDPQRRFILLNSLKMKEGEGTKEGLVIEEILKNGIIFSFEGHRFFTSL